MPPPMPNPTKRMTANPARPVARYRPGKPIAGQESSDEEEEELEEEQPQQQQQPQRKPQARPPQPKRPQAPVQEESDDDDEEGFVTEPEDEDGDTATKIPPQTGKPAAAQSRPAASVKREETQPGSEEEEEDESEDEDEEGESSEEEEESSSEEEQPRRKFQRPTFIKKSVRTQTPADGDTGTDNPVEDEQTRRRAQAEQLIKDKLERDALARAQGRKAWDDDGDVVPEAMVDDTDGIDPEAEYAAWKVRELKRLKRDREALIAREKELEEIERRRNLTAEEREREDREFLEKQRAEREADRPKAQFLAQYHHKGAFFQGDEAAEILKRRNVMGAQFEDQVSDKSTLPEYMRLRDMTKLGKKGRTRYTDLRGQDTGQFGDDVKRWRGAGTGEAGRGASGGFGGVDDRFLPDDQRGGGRTGPSGANATAVAPRREGDRDRGTYHDKEAYGNDHRDRDRDRDRDRGGYKESDRSYDRDGTRHSRKRSYSSSRSRSRSRSRSPQRRRRDTDERYWDRDRDRDHGRAREKQRERV